jgi:hypothetical protein
MSVLYHPVLDGSGVIKMIEIKMDEASNTEELVCPWSFLGACAHRATGSKGHTLFLKAPIPGLISGSEERA